MKKNAFTVVYCIFFNSKSIINSKSIMNHYNILINFLTKYLFILNAASDGWSICYIGGNRFEFYKKIGLNINKQIIGNKYINRKLDNILRLKTFCL